jgi:putative phosphoserine phosphatase/1-acylglycerol-3-phosphate O-acyltransferase
MTTHGVHASFVWRAVLTVVIMTIVSLLLIPVALVAFFRARRVSAWVATRVARLLLRLWGIRVVLHQDQPFPTRQTVFVSNHTSTLDLFVLVALGLPNTRFFLSGFLRKHVPLGIIATLMGTFFTVLQDRPEERVRIFQRADRILRRTGESVYLSPEGERVVSGDIGPFNRGAFHLATSLGAPIVPLYFAIPAEVDPGLGYDARPGDVDVYVKPAIDTSRWRVEDVNANKARVRQLFVAWHGAMTRRDPHRGSIGHAEQGASVAATR